VPGLTLLLALAVSVDGFSAGLSCGLRGLLIPFPSLLVICCSSAAAVTASMLLGGEVAGLLPVHYVTSFGGGLLIVLGTYVTMQYAAAEGRDQQAPAGAGGNGPGWMLAALVRKPEKADLDRSGVLSLKEALLLGAALAADAFGAGFGAALLGLPLPVTVLAVGATKLLLVPLGVALGRVISGGAVFKHAALLGGAILIFLGIITIV
jgi:putative sporulation protein YtaF